MRWPKQDAMRGQSDGPLLGRLLRFDKQTEARYEAEHGASRVLHLRHTIFFGILMYALHDFSSYFLLPDEYWFIVPATLFGIVPSSLVIAYLLSRVSPEMREQMVLSALLGATALPISMFFISKSPLSSHMNVEIILCVVYANMVMALRFRYALVYTAAILLGAISATMMKQGLDSSLRFALCFQFTSACVLSAYSNYLFERRRCRDYSISLGALLRAEAAENSEKQFQQMSKTDPLTGLPNRRFLDERLDEWFSDSRSAVVMMVDIDHFKLFNDTLGHQAGDECLKTIADAFRNAFSEPHLFCARFGGEEFTLVIRDADHFQARHLANAVVRSIEALNIPHPGRGDGLDVVTVSVGVALKPRDEAISQEAVLSQADEALYQAKRQGRNRYVSSVPAAGAGEMAGVQHAKVRRVTR